MEPLELLGVPRSTYYYQPQPENSENLRLLLQLDQLYLKRSSKFMLHVVEAFPESPRYRFGFPRMDVCFTANSVCRYNREA